MLNLFLGMTVSLLPSRYRQRLPASLGMDMGRGAIVSGLIESIVCLMTVIVRYLAFLPHRVGELAQRAMGSGAEDVLAVPAVQFGMGYAVAMEYLSNPVTLALIYFSIEGVVRVFAAVVTDEIVGTLPLYGIAWMEYRIGQARAERALGPRVPDLVEEVYSPDYDLRIFACRRKKNWDSMATVEWKDQLYEVLGEQPGKPPHNFIYRLRKSPPGRVVRTVELFDPQGVMREKLPRSGVLDMLTDWTEERLARWIVQRSPAGPDIVEGVQGAEYQLRVASARRKPGWDHLITIEYQGELYEVFEQKKGTTLYPYVYLLRKIPPGKIVRTVQRYSPDGPKAPPVA